MNAEFFMSPSFNFSGSSFYRIASGISKIELESSSTFYSGAYLGSDELFRHSVKQSQKLAFEGVYRSGETLHDKFIEGYFDSESMPSVAVICKFGDLTYMSRGKTEIEKLEITEREISVKGVFYPIGNWGDCDLSVYDFPEEE